MTTPLIKYKEGYVKDIYYILMISVKRSDEHAFSKESKYI